LLHDHLREVDRIGRVLVRDPLDTFTPYLVRVPVRHDDHSALRVIVGGHSLQVLVDVNGHQSAPPSNQSAYRCRSAAHIASSPSVRKTRKNSSPASDDPS